MNRNAPNLVPRKLTEADDPRLAGWIQVTDFRCAEDTVVKVWKLTHHPGRRYGPSEFLSIMIEGFDYPLFFERPHRFDRRTLAGLDAWLREMFSLESLGDEVDRIRALSQEDSFYQSLTIEDYPALDSLPDEVVLLERLIDDARAADPALGARVEAALDLAIGIGRVVREAELAELNVKSGLQTMKKRVEAKAAKSKRISDNLCRFIETYYLIPQSQMTEKPTTFEDICEWLIENFYMLKVSTGDESFAEKDDIITVPKLNLSGIPTLEQALKGPGKEYSKGTLQNIVQKHGLLSRKWSAKAAS